MLLSGLLFYAYITCYFRNKPMDVKLDHVIWVPMYTMNASESQYSQ